MNRILLGLICCCPLLLNVPLVQSVELVGPYDDENVIQTSPKPVIRSTSRQTAPTTYGPIKSSETLWSIATKLRPNNNVSVYQTIAAIYKFNPNAFLDGDINKIISSSRIRVPSAGFVAQQTDAEAMRLLNPVRKVAPQVIAKPIVKPTVKPTVTAQVKKEPVKTPIVDTTENKKSETNAVAPEILEELKKEIEVKEEALTNNQALLSDQEKEFAKLSEQLIDVTEANQLLKLKLQPLTDQIDSLSEQVDEDIKTQAELQAIIEEYRQQIEAFEPPPFSGEGLLNAILRNITSSISVLLLSMLVPLLLLTAIFLFILRLKSKKELDLKEQELAESTSLLSDDDSGAFDEFLSDEVEEVHNLKIEDLDDLDNDEDLINETPKVDEAVNLTDSDTENESASSDTQTSDQEMSEDDFEFDNNDKDDIIELSEIDFDSEDDTSQADLDLAAAWEAQIAESQPGDDIDLDELSALEESFGPASEKVEEEKGTGIDEPVELSQSTLDELFSEAELETDNETEQVDILPEQAVEQANTETEAEINTELVEEELVAEESVDQVKTEMDQEIKTEAEELVDPVKSESESEIKSDVGEEELIAEELIEAAAPTVDAAESTLDEAETEDDNAINPEDNAEELVLEEADELVDLVPEEVEIEEDATLKSAINIENDEDDLAFPESISDEVDTEDDLIESEDEKSVSDDVAIEDDLIEQEDEKSLSDDVAIEDDLIEPEDEKSLSDDVAIEDDLIEQEDEKSLSDDVAIEDDLIEQEDERLLSENDETFKELVFDEEEPEIIFETAEDENDFEQSIKEQFNQNAFKEDVDLPTIDKNDDKGYIDIDTLLTGSDGEELTEEEFNLDFGLDEFPDVVKFSEFDNDDDGIAAQLDLARAYLEIDEKEGAKTILNKLVEVAKDGKLKEVQKLLKRLN